MSKKLDWIIVNLSIFFCVFPLILFAFGWLKTGYAVLFSILIIYSTYKVSHQFEYTEISVSKKELAILLCAILISIIWVGLSGIGGFGLQSWDFHGRNAILHDLISHPWPVQYDYANQPEMSKQFGDHGYLVYYFSFFLPAALIGKLLGWFGANLFLFFWTILGIIITFFLLFKFFKRISVLIVFTFIFFSGMDFLGSVGIANNQIPEGFSYLHYFFSSIIGNNQLEWWAGNIFQYSSFTTQLFNVFNQCIPAWIITLIIIQFRDLKSIWFFYSLLFLYGPFPFVGLFPFVVIKLTQLAQVKHNESQFQKRFWVAYFDRFFEKKPDWMNFQNIVGGILILFVSGIFLLSNAGNHEFGLIWQFHKNIWALIFVYLVFCALEFLLLGFVLLPICQEKKLLWIVMGILIMLPILKYGKMNDFVMRASIPALLILFLITYKTLFLNQKTNINMAAPFNKIIIIIILIIGSITPFHEFNRSVNAIIQFPEKPLVMDKWISFDFGGYIDKTETVKNFIVKDYSKITTLFFKK